MRRQVQEVDIVFRAGCVRLQNWRPDAYTAFGQAPSAPRAVLRQELDAGGPTARLILHGRRRIRPAGLVGAGGQGSRHLNAKPADDQPRRLSRQQEMTRVKMQ